MFFFFSIKVVENQKRGCVDSSLFHSYSSRDYLELQLASLVTSSSGQDRGRSDPLAQSQYSCPDITSNFKNHASLSHFFSNFIYTTTDASKGEINLVTQSITGKPWLRLTRLISGDLEENEALIGRDRSRDLNTDL